MIVLAPSVGLIRTATVTADLAESSAAAAGAAADEDDGGAGSGDGPGGCRPGEAVLRAGTPLEVCGRTGATGGVTAARALGGVGPRARVVIGPAAAGACARAAGAGVRAVIGPAAAAIAGGGAGLFGRLEGSRSKSMGCVWRSLMGMAAFGHCCLRLGLLFLRVNDG